MKQTIKLGQNIYPDFDLFDPENIKILLESEYNIELSFLLDDGIELSWDDSEYHMTTCPADVSFYKISAEGHKELMVTYTESWKALVFQNNRNEDIIRIPIYEDELKLNF